MTISVQENHQPTTHKETAFEFKLNLKKKKTTKPVDLEGKACGRCNSAHLEGPNTGSAVGMCSRAAGRRPYQAHRPYHGNLQAESITDIGRLQ